jgi:hypothetical protein
MKAEDDEAWAGRAGLPLALAVAARHAGIALALALALGIAARWPRRIPHMLLWAAPVVTLQLAYQWLYFGSPVSHGFSGGFARFSAPWGVGHLGLLVSPGKGLVFFTPVALIAAAGLVRALIRGERWLAATLGAGFVAHWLLVGRWAEWHGGECWGPRLMTDALPFLFLFLSDGLDLLPRLGVVLAAVSVGVQALGAFAYDYRWERLYQRPPTAGHPELWQPARSPILFHLDEHVLIFARPGVREGRAIVYEHRVVPFGPEGSRIGVADESLRVAGEQARFGDVHLLRGARVEAGRIRFEHRWDGLFLRVRPQARTRPFELRIEGRGRGTLYVGEQTFWSKPHFASYAMAGSFSIRHPYDYPDSGGPDVTVTIGRAAGNAAIASVALIDPRAAGP